LTVGDVDLPPHHRDDESDEEREHETDYAERKPCYVVVLVAFEARKR
jgi:hypothetical protein